MDHNPSLLRKRRVGVMARRMRNAMITLIHFSSRIAWVIAMFTLCLWKEYEGDHDHIPEG